MHERTRRLRSIVAQQGWSLAQLAAKLGRQKRTARGWCAEHRIIPAHSLEMLELRLQLAAAQEEVSA